MTVSDGDQMQQSHHHGSHASQWTKVPLHISSRIFDYAIAGDDEDQFHAISRALHQAHRNSTEHANLVHWKDFVSFFLKTGWSLYALRLLYRRDSELSTKTWDTVFATFVQSGVTHFQVCQCDRESRDLFTLLIHKLRM